MRLMNGAAAPLFTTTAVDGTTVDLATYRGTRTLLSFFRYTGCPLCNIRFWYLAQRYPHYQALGLRIITVFESSVADVQGFAKKQTAPFPIIADPKRELYTLYGLETSWLGFLQGFLRVGDFNAARERGLAVWRINGTAHRMPADFLLEPDLTIATAHYGKDFGNFLPFDAINAFLGEAPVGV